VQFLLRSLHRYPRENSALTEVARGFCGQRSLVGTPDVGGEAGAGRLTVLVFGALVTALIFVGYQVIPFYYYYFEFKNQLQGLVSGADRHNDVAMRSKVVRIMEQLEIPATEREVQIDRRDGSLGITVPYTEILYFSFRGKDYDLYEFRFRASAQGAL
jgi:hypothetical protein